MIPVEEARARLLHALRPTPPEIVSLSEAWGRVTANPVIARLSHPPAAVSAMDGYAVIAAGAGAATRLAVAGAAPAGHPWTGPALAPGQALRVFTGSVIPEGADSVVIQEDVDRDGDTILLRQAAVRGHCIRPGGQDFAAGDTLIAAGRLLTARDVGLAAAGNHPWIAVHRRPRVGILATGDEIALPGEPVPAGGIVSSNTHALAALVRGAGGEPVAFPAARDDWDSLDQAIRAAAGLDLLLTSGGASVGEHDRVRDALQRQGMALDFWTVAMRPGKPLMHGTLRGMTVLGLPGNPVSTLVTAILFARPAIERLCGLPGTAPDTSRATLGAALPANDHRADHLRARLDRTADGGLVATAFGRQDSGMMRLAAQAEALILRAPHAPAESAGGVVAVIRLDQFGI